MTGCHAGVDEENGETEAAHALEDRGRADCGEGAVGDVGSAISVHEEGKRLFTVALILIGDVLRFWIHDHRLEFLDGGGGWSADDWNFEEIHFWNWNVCCRFCSRRASSSCCSSRSVIDDEF